MKDEITHGGSRKSLLGEKPSEADILEYSNELKVTADTPPAIILLSDDDKGVVPANSFGIMRLCTKPVCRPQWLYIHPEVMDGAISHLSNTTTQC